MDGNTGDEFGDPALPFEPDFECPKVDAPIAFISPLYVEMMTPVRPKTKKHNEINQ